MEDRRSVRVTKTVSNEVAGSAQSVQEVSRDSGAGGWAEHQQVERRNEGREAGVRSDTCGTAEHLSCLREISLRDNQVTWVNDLVRSRQTHEWL